MTGPDSLQETASTQPESQADAAYRRLEESLVTLDLEPGSQATEGALIALVGLGRTPVREAIQRLAWEGLLEIRPRAGIRVAPLIESDWIKVLEARRGVEAVLARAAARNLTPAAAQGFARAAAAMQQAVADRDTRAFLAADKAFDLALAEAADNAYAARLAAPLQTHSRRFWFASARPDSLAEAAAHHLDLINAILERDGTLAHDEALRLMALLEAMARGQ
ncbi:GntR family transcriptional regulator [Zhengella mangrovi]|uniref:GntR family transcriptional regulator n=1 Tax=Zhengella mangrovi TaxID=1982044 RepID=A0A2G1QKJ2_9HYPH|nr:GntR family transcriptional regulator [Zhengella mangrovi]PHP66046.1 GntR family transcriptional regulator [Zhengella mangrovi]